MMRRIFTPMNIIGLLLLLAALYAKDWVSRPPPQPTAPKLQLEEVQPQTLNIYYSDKQALGYVKESRQLQIEGTSAGKVAQALALAWAKGPQQGQGLRVVPPNSDIPEVWLRSQHYIVNLPASYTALNYGLRGEHMIVCSLTRTLLDKSGQDVLFLVGGKPVNTLLGHIDTRSAFTKADCPD